jgi:hypothetical protein
MSRLLPLSTKAIGCPKQAAMPTGIVARRCSSFNGGANGDAGIYKDLFHIYTNS